MNREKDKGKQKSKFGNKKSRRSAVVHPIKKIARPQEPNGYLLFVFFTLLITFILTYNLPTRSLPNYQQGDVCRWDIKAPKELMVIDQEQTELRRKQAVKNVLTVFDFDTETKNQKILSLQNIFQKWRDKISTEELASIKRNELQEKQVTGIVQETVELNDPDEMHLLPTPLPEVRHQTFIDELGYPISLKSFQILQKSKMSKEIEKSIIHAFNLVYTRGIVISREDFLKETANGFTRRNLSSSQETAISFTDSILDMKSVAQFLTQIKDQISAQDLDSKPVIHDFILSTLKPNLTLNQLETQARIKAARNSVKNVMLQAKPGQIIVREGDRVEETHLLFLKEIGSLQEGENQLFLFAGTFLILSVMGVLYMKYVKYFRPMVYSDRKNLYLIASIVFLILLTSRLFLVLFKILSSYFSAAPFDSIAPYLTATPFAAASLMIAMLVDTPAALLISIYQSVAAGILTGGDFGTTILALVGCVAVVLGIIRHKRRTDIIRAGLIVCLSNVLIVLGISLTGDSYFSSKVPFAMFCGVVGGFFVVLIVSTMTPALESLFRITTDIRLAELSSFDHPLIKQMILNAPGTHQHSILVGSLAEAAAESIGSNALLARVASYFHDIGKIRKPYYFIENIGNKDKNQHDKLSPNLSGLVIISHVKEGVEMAKKAKLGKQIINIIQEHHGTRILHYFYKKALESEQKSNQEPSIESFKYPGPKPASREAAIVLLADQIEAASRTLNAPTHAKIKALVRKIINANLIDEQLENCDLTLTDIGKISDSFIRILTAMFHHRIDYPGIQFEGDEKLENISILRKKTNDKQDGSDECMGSK